MTRKLNHLRGLPRHALYALANAGDLVARYLIVRIYHEEA